MTAAFGKSSHPRSSARVKYAALALLSAICIARSATAQGNWSQFRGASGVGVADDAVPPTEWSADQNLLWKVQVPGVGWSQPIVWGNRIFLTTAVTENQATPDPSKSGPGFDLRNLAGSAGLSEFTPPDVTYRWQTLCIDLQNGASLWERTAHEGKPPIHIHPNNTYASETPASDGEIVVAYFGMLGAYAYDLEGRPLWSKEFDAHPTQFGWGTGSSPVIFEDRVFIQCDNDEASYLVALDKKTGEPLWRVDRDEKSNWSTPYVWRNRLRTEIITAAGGKMRSYDPKSGELLWEMAGQGRAALSPVGNEELLYVDSADRLMGIRGRLHAIRAGAQGDISLSGKQSSNEHVAWSASISASRLASPLLLDGRLYLLEQSSILHCFDAKTGEELERQRLSGARGFVASPLAAAGHLYCLDQGGTTFVLRPGAKVEIIAKNPLNEMSWASPAAVGNRLIVRGVEHLYCIGPQ